MIGIVSLACAIIGFGFSTFVMSKEYSSRATIYITPKVTEQGALDYNSIQTNSRMVNNYMEMLKGENILSAVASNLKLSSYEEVLNSLTISNAENTEIIAIESTTENPELSRDIVVNTIQEFTNEMMDVLQLNNITVINDAKVNPNPVSPSKTKFTLLGFVGGIVLSCGFVFVQFLFDKRLRNREDAENYLGIPVLASVPLKK